MPDSFEDYMMEYLKKNFEAKDVFETKSAAGNFVLTSDEEKDDLCVLDEDWN